MPWKKPILFLIVPPASCVHFPLIVAGANGKFIIISSLEVQIQTYTNIEKSRFLLTPNLRMFDFFWHLPPTTPPEQAIQPLLWGHRRWLGSFSCTRSGSTRRRCRSAGTSPSSAAWWMPSSSPRGFRVPRASLPGGSGSWGKKSVQKMISKKRPKIGEPWLLDPNFGLFLWQIVKEAFKFSDSSLFVPVVFCFDVIFGVQNVPLGCEERCMYQTWGKRLY